MPDTPNSWLASYSKMLEIRIFEERVADLVEEKQIHTPCHLCIGQEAIAVGACFALEASDHVWAATDRTGII